MSEQSYMKLDDLRNEIRAFLNFRIPEASVTFTTHELEEKERYRQLHISYQSEEGDEIPAFLFLPDGAGPFGAIVVHHQHHGQRHYGKSEVAGLVGDPLQAFGPALAQKGMIVLAPDSICFEDRRKNRTGTETDEDADVAQHYNELCYRLLRGDTLMRKVLVDSAQAISLLRTHPLVDAQRIGMLGHSYGGNTVLFHGALDERISFGCSSGAACTYEYKIANQIGIEMAEVIPGFATRFDIDDLVTCFAPRPLLIVSATEDAASYGAGLIVARAHNRCTDLGVKDHLEHKRYQGTHALTQERFDEIVNWLAALNSAPQIFTHST